uniref:Uncharacterized protein n=1 Tax=Acrobeloides nanus TaxID=290746 RepID=A0A914DAY5_9BILA
MASLYSSPSYHNISPLTRSRSGSRSDVRTPALRRSGSYTSARQGGFTLPSYGYGGGYMSRSLSRSGSTLFGRSLTSSALHNTPPLHSVAVQRSTPHYSDKFPYVRYSYGNTDTGLAIMSQSDIIGKRDYGIRDIGTKRWLEGKLNAYNTGLFTRPYQKTVERPITPSRTYVKYLPREDALDLYKKNCMTVGTLSKYWLSPGPTNRSSRETSSSLGYNVYKSRFNSYNPRSVPNRLSAY